MILYLDTSSLVKLYLDEAGASEVRLMTEEADWVSTSVLSYPEAHSAFARQKREGRISAEGHEMAKASLQADWANFVVVDLLEPIWRRAATLVEEHSLESSRWPSVSILPCIVAQLSGRQHPLFILRQAAQSSG